MPVREVHLPEEIGVIVTGEEVPEEVRAPAERAARKAANKATRGVVLRFARPELEEEVTDRYRFERDNQERISEIAEQRGWTTAEVAYELNTRTPEVAGCRTALDYEDVIYNRPDSVVVRLTTEADRETLVYMVAACYRRADWDLRGRDALARRNKLKSYDMESDVRLYARDVVDSNRPW